MKGCICHLAKCQIHPFTSKGTKYVYTKLPKCHQTRLIGLHHNSSLVLCRDVETYSANKPEKNSEPETNTTPLYDICTMLDLFLSPCLAYRPVTWRHLANSIDLLISAGCTQETQNIFIKCVRCWTSVEDVGPTSYRCSKSGLCLLGRNY